MEIKIGEVIKKLRIEQSITQEKLSEYLTVSPQSVSKWENGVSYPDITLVPKIAMFFKVSTDELFSMSTAINNQKFIEYEATYEELQRQGDVRSQIALNREMFLEYPRNYKVMFNLASSLIACYQGLDSDYQLAIDNKYLNEAIKLNEIILNECPDVEIRLNVIKNLCRYYPTINQTEKAMALVSKLPSIDYSKDILLEDILTGEQCIEQQQTNLLEFVDLAAQRLVQLSFVKGKNIIGLSIREKIEFVSTSINLYKLIIRDENYLYFHSRLAENYRRLAELYLSNNQHDKCIHNLNLAFNHAKMYDKLLDKNQYTSPFVCKCTFDKNNKFRNHQEGECELLYYRLTKQGTFENLEDYPGYNKLKKELFDLISK